MLHRLRADTVHAHPPPLCSSSGSCLPAQSALDQRGSGWKKRCGTRTKPYLKKRVGPRWMLLLPPPLPAGPFCSWSPQCTESMRARFVAPRPRRGHPLLQRAELSVTLLLAFFLSSNIWVWGAESVSLLACWPRGKVRRRGRRERKGRGRTGGRRRGILMLNLMPSWQQQQLVSREEKTGWRERHICLTSLNFPAGLLWRQKGHVTCFNATFMSVCKYEQMVSDLIYGRVRCCSWNIITDVSPGPICETDWSVFFVILKLCDSGKNQTREIPTCWKLSFELWEALLVTQSMFT